MEPSPEPVFTKLGIARALGAAVLVGAALVVVFAADAWPVGLALFIAAVLIAPASWVTGWAGERGSAGPS